MPQRTVYGSVWSSYRQERKNSVDILLLGSSRVYCDVIPGQLYADTGVTSYVMAGPSQTIPLTYYYLRACLKTQTPNYVFVEVSGVFFSDVGKDVKANVCYMPMSLNRLRALKTCKEGTLDLALFPLEEFHYRIYEKRDEQPPKYDGTLLCGYTPLDGAKPQAAERTIRTSAVRPGSEYWASNLDYLEKIAALCQKKGIPCICFLTPMRNVYRDEDVDELIAAVQAMPGITAMEDWRYLDEELEIDPEKDWYDSIHFNISGAKIFTQFLSGYVSSLGLAPSQGEDEALWQKRVSYIG